MKASKKRKSKSRAESRTSNLGEPAPIIIPKPHRTDHVLHSFFKDLFGKPEEIQLDTAPSQDGVMATRETNADPETVASDDELLNSLKHKIQLYKDLERHLQQARSKALSEDEQYLSRMREQYPSCDNPTLIRHTSLISSHLDTALLREHGLLTPSDCLPPSIPTRNTPPKEEFPSYMDPTVTSELHATFKQNGNTIKDQSSQIVIPLKNHISSEERLQGQNALSELKRKTTFIHNPRQSAHKHTNTASNGVAKMRQGERRGKEKDLNLFMAEPSELVFTGYSPGQSYEKLIDFRNISGASRQMRVVPPKSPYFKIKIAHFPNPEGIVAPGMTCTYSVKFFPDSLADFEDEIKVITQNGEQLTVTLRGYRPPPDLSVPSVLQCGHCLVGDRLLLTFPCINSGGEGNFRLMTQEREEGEGGVLRVGVFTISPTFFHLSPGASIDLKVEFHPDKAELYTYDFIMACDNGQCNTFTITGTGDMLTLCCVHATQSANSIVTANTYAESAGYYSLIEPPVEVSIVDGSVSVVQFDNTNPGIPVYKTVVIRNYSGVRLSYHWCYYHPRTELSNDTVSPLVPVTSCPFVLEHNDSSMELLPGETKLLPLVYKPSKVSKSHVMVLMELEGVPLSSLDHNEEGWGWIRVGEERVSPLCLELKGSADPYEVHLSPSLICFDEGLAPCTERKRTIKITNNSIGSVSFEWNYINQDQCTVVIEPSIGTIVSGGRQYCECTVSATSIPGPFSLSLSCNISNNEDNHTLHIKGHTQLPVVTTDCPSLCYGLIQLDQSCSVPLTLTNVSKCSAEFQLKQITDNENTEGVVNYSCVQCTPDHGVILPNSSITISTVCNPMIQCGRLRSAVELSVIGIRTNLIPVTGEIQRPSLVLEQSSVYLEDCYIGVPHTQSITIINRGLLPAQYEWIRDTYDHCEIDYSPSKGLIDPKGRATIDITTTWNNEGYYTGVLAVCRVESMSEPLLLSLSSRVKGLTVHYSLQGSNDAIMDDDLKLDFGSSNPIGVPQELCLVASNTSAVTTQLTVSVELFTAAHIGDDSTIGIRSTRSSLLRSTRNIVDPTAKTDKQNKSDLYELLLADGRGCCFALCPSQCTLLPFQSQTIKVTAHSDMWGQHTDNLLCKVNGIVRYIPISYGVTGSPLVFPVTATRGETIVRFGSQPAGSQSVKRSVKLTNTSSSDIRIDWRVFNYTPDDNKLIDLISYIGQPFPKLSANNDSQPVDDNETHPLIRAIIKPHEGVWSTGYPFTIEPKQMTISPKTTSTITIHFNPSIDSYNVLGEHIDSYILGYYSLDNKPPVRCVRLSGYDLIPLKISITASIQHPKLILETIADDDSLSFTHKASELMKITDDKIDILPSVTLPHSFTLTNPTDSVLTFHITPPSPPFTLHDTELSHITLKPHQKIEKSIGYCIDHCEILQQKDSQTILSADVMSVQFDTGAIQRFPIASRVHLPDISIHPTLLDFGIVHVLQSQSAAVQLRNNSHSPCMWKASIPQDTNGVVSVTPMEGVLGICNSDTWVTTLTVTLTPGSETSYSVVVMLQELLTHSQLQLTVTGHGSADERVRVKRKKNKRL